MSLPVFPAGRPPFAEPSSPRAGKRLSFWRVLLGLVVVAAVVLVSIFGFRFFVVDQARASQAAPSFAGYVDATVTPQYAFEAPATDAQNDVVLSFVVAHSATDCTPSWGAAYTLDAAAENLDIDRRIARLRQLGGDPIVSFGGAINTDLATACTNVGDLTKAYKSVIDRYDLSTIDLDVEAGDLSDSLAGERRAVAIAALQSERRAQGDDLTVWLTLPTMPTGLTADGTRLVSQMLADGVDLAGVNIMTMDYGIDLHNESMGQVAIDALNAVHAQLASQYITAGTQLTDASLWAKLGATPMIGQNDVAGEVFTLADAAQLNAFGQLKQLGRLSAWSLNRDRSCGPNYLDLATVSNQCSGVDQGSTTFAEVLNAGFGGGLSATPLPVTTVPASDAAGTQPTPTPTSTAPAARGRESDPPADDPATSPYPIWAAGVTYVAGTKVVWHATVYEAKWWTLGDVPDNPVLTASSTPWALIGPVLAGETPYVVPTLPVGTYPDWSGNATYNEGDRVLFNTVPYVAKWWTRGDSPAAAVLSADSSPWLPLTAAQVAAVSAGTAGTAATP
ncbi:MULTISPECIES: chitinase [Subtercola]|uniref:Glycosyl hydrolase family 18 n=1 Tax=Subtercola vilae TaxID=2056433 RepID=A0A4T2CEM7_9MICO|nr:MULTISPECIES: carbohydrate-binding protein [Subtercola]MEA9983973.1 glycosyl hydrolase family 18 [Subtercola sp. RTI3]TIH40956.1 glycosyl hydrolase family 18 [Subtercola vilae]